VSRDRLLLAVTHSFHHTTSTPGEAGGLALVFAVESRKVLAFGKGTFTHTRHLPAGR
jgi:hypothetical protein